MIDIDFKNQVYICPFCGCRQSYSGNYTSHSVGYKDYAVQRTSAWRASDLAIYHIECTNRACSKITVVARNLSSNKQFDLYPENVHKEFPDYVPQQIRADYVEAVAIISKSPKASATLLRRCLQGMIRDFWGIKKSRLKDEIDELQSKVAPSQWAAIDGLRKLGNIGAHMEKDINVIIDVDEGEAEKLAQLIELLIEKWYIGKHDDEELYKNIVNTASNKK